MNIIGVEHSLVYKIMRELKQMGFDATPVEDENDSNNDNNNNNNNKSSSNDYFFSKLKDLF